MMINKRLIGTVSESTRYIKRNVIYQWLGLISNIVLIISIALLLEQLAAGYERTNLILITAVTALIAIVVRFFSTVMAAKMSALASEQVKKTLREKIMRKLLRLGSSYHQKVSTSEVVQVAAEGVEQLEVYFGRYLPQLFYSLLAPLTLFAVLSFISLKAALILLICVPLIPVSIIAVQRFAKKLLSKYWGAYTNLGDSFLENLQGLTTLKIYRSDAFKHEQMNEEAENFRKITMKVLTMQLNSITVMDLIAFGGAAVGLIVAVWEYQQGNLGFAGCFAIILLAADFFIPLRLLGSFFHIAMNGMAASDKIFHLLDLPEDTAPKVSIPELHADIRLKQVGFGYTAERTILHDVSINIHQGSLVSIVGTSGSGKSTIASLLMGMNKGYTGSITIGGQEISAIAEEDLMKQMTLVSHNSYLFKGTVRDNLLMGMPNATEAVLWQVLEQVKLADYLRSQDGLETQLEEKASNLSGGQRQRLALARALLHDTPVYLFDEATSNIDVESENYIMALIHEIAKKKTVILISHRLANVIPSDCIYVLSQGTVVEAGNHEDLMQQNGVYAELYLGQQSLEYYAEEGGCHA